MPTLSRVPPRFPLDGVLFTENEWIPRQGLRAELL